MENLTTFELWTLVECCSNYTAHKASLKKGAAQTRIINKARVELRKRGEIKPIGRK